MRERIPLTFYLLATDVLLMRSQVKPDMAPEALVDLYFGKGNPDAECYGYFMCRLLAHLESTVTIHNADTVSLLTDEICLSLGHPELRFDDTLGAPKEREVAERDQHFYSVRWDCFRHQSRQRIQTLEGYDRAKDAALDPTDVSNVMYGPIQREEGVWQDEGLLDVQYGGDGQPW